MNQEENANPTNTKESENDSAPENLISEEVDHLPTESIGSYGRIEPLINDETEYPEEGDVER